MCESQMQNLLYSTALNVKYFRFRQPWSKSFVFNSFKCKIFAFRVRSFVFHLLRCKIPWIVLVSVSFQWDWVEVRSGTNRTRARTTHRSQHTYPECKRRTQKILHFDGLIQNLLYLTASWSQYFVFRLGCLAFRRSWSEPLGSHWFPRGRVMQDPCRQPPRRR
jgi:hypothetical protein